MSFTTICPCGRKIDVPDDRDGTSIKCKVCGAAFTASRPKATWFAYLPVSVAMCAPSCRMVIVWGHASRDPETKRIETRHRIEQVLCISSTITQTYCCYVPDREDRPPTAPDHAGMIANGWEYQHTRTNQSPVISMSDYGITEMEDAMLNFEHEGESSHWQAVSCDWPIDADNTRLKPIIKALKAKAVADFGPRIGSKQDQPLGEGDNG